MTNNGPTPGEQALALGLIGQRSIDRARGTGPAPRGSGFGFFYLLLLVLLVGGVITNAGPNPGDTHPEVGDCIVASGATEFDAVDCGSAEAQYRVIGIPLERPTEVEFTAAPLETLCAAFPASTAAFWRHTAHGMGKPFCVAPV